MHVLCEGLLQNPLQLPVDVLNPIITLVDHKVNDALQWRHLVIGR